MGDAECQNTVKSRLPRAWPPFFSRFGSCLEVQLLTIPKILDGKNIIIASPTASGKTEAVVAPVAELFKNKGWQGLAIVYVSPTRALVNDAYRRISDPLAELGIATRMKHGDTSDVTLKNLPNCLITTPESLDSLLCRYPVLFDQVRVAIIDEVHMLDNTYRGDQLRILLRRLRACNKSFSLSIHLLSATISDPDGLAKRYIDAPYEYIALSANSREIDSRDISSVQDLVTMFKAQKWCKALVFCNMREKVEEIAGALKPLWRPYPVVVHHGSLSKIKREETEQVLKENKTAICVATSTLEVGIDIGNIDVVVIAEVPWSLASFVQRIGRANRREQRINVITFPRTGSDQQFLQSMLQAVERGEVYNNEEYGPDRSVVIQQTFSLLKQQSQGLNEDSLFGILEPLCTRDELRLILEHLTEKEYVFQEQGMWFPKTKLIDLAESGFIYTNIPDEVASFHVIDVASGKEIGRIEGTPDKNFLLAQGIWHCEKVGNNTIHVSKYEGKGTVPRFSRQKMHGKFHNFLPSALR